jgi:hypothetical protein
MTKTNYTPKQGELLALTYYYTRIHRRPPAEADNANSFLLAAACRAFSAATILVCLGDAGKR